jgi:hypothetical protein
MAGLHNNLRITYEYFGGNYFISRNDLRLEHPLDCELALSGNSKLGICWNQSHILKIFEMIFADRGDISLSSTQGSLLSACTGHQIQILY